MKKCPYSVSNFGQREVCRDDDCETCPQKNTESGKHKDLLLIDMNEEND